MRRVIIQIYCIYFSVFFLVTGIICAVYKINMAPFLIGASLLNGLVAVKIMMFKVRTNMFYNTFFIFLSLLLNTFLIQRYQSINLNKENQYLFFTLPPVLKGVFIILNATIFMIAIYEFLASKDVD